MGQTFQFQSLIDQVNANSKCSTLRCNGILVPVGMRVFGLGGAIDIRLACTGCTDRVLTFPSSAQVPLSNRAVVSIALQVAFIAAGCAHAQYSKVLKQSLGMSAVSKDVFLRSQSCCIPWCTPC